MEYQRLESDAVEAVAYDDRTSTLGVRLRNGRKYHYLGVPERVYIEFLRTDSPGRYFNHYVKNGGYIHRRVD